MIGDRDVTVFYDERVLLHRPEAQEPFLPGRMNSRVQHILQGLGMEAKWSYPEHPGRVTAINELLHAEPVPGVRFEGGRPATMEQLQRVHTTSYLESLQHLKGKQAWLDVDTTAVSAGSLEAAEVAAGSVVAAVDAVFDKRTGSAFVVSRPPGHHANAVRARGFCLVNNIAVGAAHAQAHWDAERILIVDWDAHHGNGTQDIFAADPSVLFFDTHRAAPFYPGTGQMDNVGEGLGEGTTVNVPLPGEAGDRAIVRAFEDILVPAADWFKPDLVMVSAGMDAHINEMCLTMTFDGFSKLTGIVQALADTYCDGRLVMALEGGYNPDTLARCTRTTLEVMAGGAPSPLNEPGVDEVAKIAEFHRSAFADME
ncbi:histone deacetylase family protein [Salinisphaera hydrothermalis]|uniref:Histone deacetylase superfamily protein n=1 Tax=Salinisphaera hydrothermalis (strain C41B8) TaxID=1304275 RepID=A0A084IN57_SALHC|nr:histone deacetylase [Salinisphaera hydrothermalis]KEZ78141.1 histone deacetylase superfamily protein [Salinisphaera hydrothermalis C41B8]